MNARTCGDQYVPGLSLDFARGSRNTTFARPHALQFDLNLTSHTKTPDFASTCSTQSTCFPANSASLRHQTFRSRFTFNRGDITTEKSNPHASSL